MVGSDSTSAQARETANARPTVRPACQDARSRGRRAVQAISTAAASVPNPTNATKPGQLFRSFQGSGGPPAAWPTTDAMPSPTASTPQIAAAIQSELQNQRVRPRTERG